MAAPPPTVASLKLSFIAAQTSILAQPPVPSAAWRSANDASDHAIPPRALDDALFALGQAVGRHCRRVYPPQANRNVAEQIADAYSRDAERDLVDGPVRGAVPKDVDLADDDVIESLPPSWPSAKDASDYPAEAKRYVEAAARLARLSRERKALGQRVDRLRCLKASVDPLLAADGAGVQENLCTRNGPVEVELERMRFLLARVAGRVGRLPTNARDGRDMELASMAGARKRKVDEFLADAHVFPT